MHLIAPNFHDNPIREEFRDEEIKLRKVKCPRQRNNKQRREDLDPGLSDHKG